MLTEPEKGRVEAAVLHDAKIGLVDEGGLERLAGLLLGQPLCREFA
jgi:hypothetical protein